MKRAVTIEEVEYEGSKYDADFDVHTVDCDDYGADADGNRGVSEWIIDEIEITGLARDGEVIDPKCVSEELKDRLIEELVDKLYA